MFKDKAIREILLGKTSGKNWFRPNSRTTSIEFPSNGTEPHRNYLYMSDDGFILHLIRMIEKLEERIEVLETKKK